jgi:pyruvate/2-oxoacid:ferredoxin oxidoreductase alpha subunit
MFGRNGESPVPIVAPQSPSDCFDAAIEAVRIATTYRTPVIVLSDGYLANGSEPWLVPEVSSLPALEVEFATEPNGVDADGNRFSSPTCATPRRWPGRGRFPAPRGWSTGSAASRRPMSPATSPTTPTTTTG